jgi:hypothetical protein
MWSPPPRRTTSCTTPRAASEWRGLRWPVAQEALRVRQTCARRDRRPCAGRAATLRLTAGGDVGGGTEAIKAKEMEPQHGSLPTRRSWGCARDGAAAHPVVHLHEAAEHPSPRMLEEEAGRSIASTDILWR